MGAVRRLEPIPVPRPRRRVRRVRPQHVEFIRYDTRRYRISLRVLFTVFLIFAGGMLTVYTFAMLQDMRGQIDRERAAISLQRAENSATLAEITQHFSVEDISRIASERLNMGPADPSQVIRIYVPRQSYIVQSEASVRRVPDNMWESALWHISNWMGIGT